MKNDVKSEHMISSFDFNLILILRKLFHHRGFKRNFKSSSILRLLCRLTAVPSNCRLTAVPSNCRLTAVPSNALSEFTHMNLISMFITLKSD